MNDRRTKSHLIGELARRFEVLVPLTFLFESHAASAQTAGSAPDAGGTEASAQSPNEPAQTNVVPPRRVSTSEVPYPDAGHGDAIVVVILTVGSDGAVREAKAIEGIEPFASAAVSAARAWQFEPALRDGQPLTARVRFEIRFHEPSAAPQEPEQGAGEPPAPEPGQAIVDKTSLAPPAPSPPAEVVVRAARRPPQATSLAGTEVRQMPGAFGDPFRAIEALPGVTPIVSGLPFFYVRGAPPGNVGYFLDGVRVPYLFHVGLGPAVIHPGLVDRVDLYSGGYPASFGRFAGGIVSAETTAPRPDWHGEGNLRVFDVGALTETGFAGGRGTVLLAGRYSYTAAILSLLAGDAKLDYRDYEARVSYDVTSSDRVTLFSFGAYDLLAQKEDGFDNVLFGTEFYRVDARYEHRFDADTRARVGVTWGFDETKIPGQPRNSQDRMLATRLDVSKQWSARTTLRVGADVTWDAYRADIRPYSDPDDPDTRRLDALFPPRDDVAIGGYADIAYRDDMLEITPGLRFDVYRSGNAQAIGIDPRLLSRVRLGDHVHVLHAIGIAHQPPSFVIPVPGLAIGQLKGGLQTSVQASAGLELDLPEATTASVTAFDNVFLNMSDTLGVEQSGDDVLQEPRSLGSAVGVEVYVRRRLTRRVAGFLAYTLSRSMRSVGRDHFPSAFDRTHVLGAALAFDLGAGWRTGARLMLYTGAPQIPSSSGLLPPPRDPSPPRDPLFYRLDLRIEKRWVLSPTTWLALVAEMMNATLRKEVVQGESIGPVSIPSIGLEASF
jgi:TonB family protein